MNTKTQNVLASDEEMPAHFAKLPVDLLREFAWSLAILAKGNEDLIQGLNAELAETRKLVDILEQRVALSTNQRDEALALIPTATDKLAEKWATALAPLLLQTTQIGFAAGGRAQKTEHAKAARAGREKKLSAPVREFVLQRYDEGSWRSIAEAAEKIYPQAEAFAYPKGVRLSKDRFPKTLGGWLKDRKNTPPTG